MPTGPKSSMNSTLACAPEAQCRPCLPARPKAVLIDLAGVLHIGEQAVPGAVEALARLRSTGLAVRFLTNTTRSPRRTLVALLQRLGFAIAPEEIQTAVRAAVQRVHQLGLKPHYLVHPDVVEEVGPSHPDPDVVVLGDAGPAFSFEALNAAFRLIIDGRPLIAMARNRYFRDGDGLTLDLGAFVAALEFATGSCAEIVGKPAPAFFLGPLAELGVAPQDAVLIGDDLKDDIGGAQAVHIPGILVRTGKYRPADEDNPAILPALVVDDFAAAVEAILGR